MSKTWVICLSILLATILAPPVTPFGDCYFGRCSINCGCGIDECRLCWRLCKYCVGFQQMQLKHSNGSFTSAEDHDSTHMTSSNSIQTFCLAQLEGWGACNCEVIRNEWVTISRSCFSSLTSSAGPIYQIDVNHNGTKQKAWLSTLLSNADRSNIWFKLEHARE